MRGREGATKKQEQTKRIIQELLNYKIGKYTRQEVDDAILRALQVRDQRTFDRWFNLLWKMQFLVQPQSGIYVLNFERVVQLEIKMPEEIDPRQRRLTTSE